MNALQTKADFFRLSIRVWGLITAAGVVAGAASVLGFFGSFNWFFDLCSHFRVQYFFGLSVVALLLLIPRRFGAAAIFGALAAVNLGMIVPLYLGSTTAPASVGVSVRAMLVNVNTRHGNAASVADAINRLKPDIVVLEEVNAKWLSDLGPALAGYGYSKRVPRADNFGIALFSRFPFTQAHVVYVGEAEVPSIIAEIETGQGTCTVLATHPLPPGGREYSRLRNGQLAELPRWVHLASSPLLLLGDLNVSPWSPYFRRLLRESGLRDSSQGRGVRPTWPTFNPLLRIPIDHCLYSPGIKIVNRQTGPNVGSDHFPVVVDFMIEVDKTGEVNHASAATTGRATGDVAVIQQFFGTAAPPSTDCGRPYALPVQVVRATLELQEKAIPILLQAMNHPDEEKSHLAVQCFAYIIVPEAAKALRERYNENKDIWIKTAFCSALACTKSPDDVRFLIESLKGKPSGDERHPAEAAAYALGLLQAKDAETALRRLAHESEGTFASQAAQCALGWINGARCATLQQNSAVGSDAVILAVFRSGIPRIDESDVFFDAKGARIWRHHDNAWVHEARNIRSRKRPSVRFDVMVTGDGQRAVCAVGMTFGPLNGSGFEFILRKEGENWIVVGVRQTWIS